MRIREGYLSAVKPYKGSGGEAALTGLQSVVVRERKADRFDREKVRF